LALDVNVSGTHLLLNACRRQDVRRFLFASTCSVYGISTDIVNESSGVNPVSHYAESKVAAERFVHGAAARRFHPTVFRLPTLFGLSPRPRFDLLVNLLTARAACEGKIRIFNGAQWRPFAHVADVARAFERCMDADASVVSGQVFNVGDGQMNLQLFGLSRVIQQLVPTVEVVCEENHDVRSYRPSFRKILTSLGFSCERSIKDGVCEIYQWLKTGKVRNFADPGYWNDRALEQAAAIACAEMEGEAKPEAQGRPWIASRAAACGT
jgi:nucleoside-diphosphate-sugar epimerase